LDFCDRDDRPATPTGDPVRVVVLRDTDPARADLRRDDIAALDRSLDCAG
jgi:hypothetical protein